MDRERLKIKQKLKEMVDAQADDARLWFGDDAQYLLYVRHALRCMHAAIENYVLEDEDKYNEVLLSERETRN